MNLSAITTLGFTIFIVLNFAWFLFSFVRAGRLANRHKDKMTYVQKVSWWSRLPQTGEFGAEDEAERKQIVRHLTTSFILTFVVIGLLALFGRQV